jgi:hypothetical protein
MRVQAIKVIQSFIHLMRDSLFNLFDEIIKGIKVKYSSLVQKEEEICPTLDTVIHTLTHIFLH